ncbi:AHH domain-containing protein [Bacillus pretiosus]|uniref:AHH domain-containing protein n=1 Tax=Bacillus pretiosus TaxID=2983392 RepID=UPI003D64BC42
MFSETGGRNRVKGVQEVIQDYTDKVLDRVEVKNKYPDSYTASKILREELKDAGIAPPYSNAAHHLTPWNDSRAEKPQKLLKEFGIDHDSAANGVFLPYKVNEYVTTEVLHIGKHSSEYILEVERVLSLVKKRAVLKKMLLTPYMI